MKFRFFLICIVVTLAQYGCTMEINPTPAFPIEETANVTLDLSTNRIPVTWSNLNLTGRLVYNAVDSTLATYNIQALDVMTGELHTVVQFQRQSWSDAVVVSPDHKTMVVAYTPPAQIPYGGQESLYRLYPEESEPLKLLVVPPTSADTYSQPAWSPDGKIIYMTHNNYKTMLRTEILRMTYPNGKPEKVIENAFWPRPSLDGKHLVYVALDPQTGKNQLSLANANGSDAHPVLVSGLPVPAVIDTPMISPDKQSILFSSPDQPSSVEPNWIDRFLGVQVAFADGTLPSDWWSVPISGGVAKQITRIQALALYGVYSPDRQFIASFSSGGIFVMKPDGTEVTMVVNDIGGITGTVSWIP